MSLLFGDNAVNNNSLSGKYYAFYYLFSECTTIIQVSESFLPATTLAGYCYGRMFQGCTSLTTAPIILPATILANYCYYYMFYGCTNLTTAPELPATTLISYCYYNMFNNCEKLNYIKMLATDISADNCLRNWTFDVLSSIGTFVKNPDMTSLPSGTSGIPSGWGVYHNGEQIGGGNISTNITFPVHLVVGDNGQLGVDLYNYLIEKYCPSVLNHPNYDINIMLDTSEKIYVTRNSVTGEVDSIQWNKTYQKFLIYALDVSRYEFAFSKDGYLFNNQSGGGAD